MASSAGFLTFLEEQLAGLGPVSIRRMFGGAGVFADGVMFALVSDDTLYLKADETTRAEFEAEGMDAFTYATKEGRNTLVTYWRAPERLFDEPDEMLSWARKALTIARRAGAKKSSSKASKTSKRRSTR
jgi:DNA transformation protein